MMKTYLGDGVYVEVERGLLKLTTENGRIETNAIYLEPAVFYQLAAYFDRAKMNGYEPEPCPYCGRLP
jgi:hypothetical protein